MKKTAHKKIKPKVFWKRVEIIFSLVSIAALAFAISLFNHSIGIRAKYATPREGNTQFYWDYGEGFSEEASRLVVTRKGVSEIKFTEKDIKRLKTFRLDVPYNKKNMCTLTGMSISAFGIDLFSYTGENVMKNLIQRHDIENVMPVENQNWKMKVTGGDPYFSFSGYFLKKIKKDVQTASYMINVACAFVIYLLERIIIYLCVRYREQITAFFKKNAFEKMKLRYIVSYASIIIFFIAVYVAFWGYRYLFKKFNGISFDEMLFHLKVPMQGTGDSVIKEIIDYVKKPMIIAVIALVVVLVILACVRIIRNNKLTMYALGSGTVVFLVVTAVLAFRDFGVGKYFKMYLQKSTFIEEEYVDPSQVTLQFPEKKRNLVYIYYGIHGVHFYLH